MKKRVALPKALAIIVFSTLLVSGPAFFFLRSWQKLQARRLIDPRYTLQYISVKGSLSIAYIEELIGLSQDNKISYYQFDEKRAQQQLLSSPFILDAKVKKAFPQTVEVEVKTRTPIAQLYDFENTLVDARGRLMPQHPLYASQDFPQIYLGLHDFDPKIYQEKSFWEERFTGEDFQLALHLMQLLSTHDFLLNRIDLSNQMNTSLGKREIVLILQNQDATTHTLRLPTKGWEKQLSNYLSMRTECDFFGKDRVVDLRLSSLAYISD